MPITKSSKTTESDSEPEDNVVVETPIESKPEPVRKPRIPKKLLTEKQLEALARGRITASINRKKRAQYNKLKKSVEDKEREEEIKDLESRQDKLNKTKHVKEKKEKQVKKPKQVIYEESSEDESSEEEQIVYKKRRARPRKQQVKVYEDDEPEDNIMFL